MVRIFLHGNNRVGILNPIFPTHVVGHEDGRNETPEQNKGNHYILVESQPPDNPCCHLGSDVTKKAFEIRDLELSKLPFYFNWNFQPSYLQY